MEVGTEAGIRPELVEEAARSLNPYLPATPLQQSRALTVKAGCQVFLKIESIQPTRSFKVRGALNKLIRMSAADRRAGVITASAGNHGQGVAYAAAAFGIAATVFVPENANLLKVESMKRLGARVVPAGRSYQEAYQEATRAQAASGATLVHAFDDPQVIAGQGTVGVEIGEQLPETDTVLVPVGGGGLLAGIALYLKARRPAVRLIGVEPQGADGLTRSLAAGQQVVLDRVQTMADGLAASGPGRLNFELLKNRVDEMIRVGEDEMLRAIRLLFEWEHLLAEPSGAASLAALLYRYTAEPDERVVLVLSGGNVTEEVMMRALRSR
ncbi:MAG: threonine ammonia-lyase [Candidatus Dormibacter sp.]|uniref:threonine ammonia-lyase n=1 Tax=Candidatus Dormibacter sp. TaxID=2973982 RepID=UPI000DB51D5F|nr:MAG: threonine ammonia-lyase [Candidatus Dormibacteraeota bacterium]